VDGAAVSGFSKRAFFEPLSVVDLKGTCDDDEDELPLDSKECWVVVDDRYILSKEIKHERKVV
jgi:hypothetical protein